METQLEVKGKNDKEHEKRGNFPNLFTLADKDLHLISYNDITKRDLRNMDVIMTNQIPTYRIL